MISQIKQQICFAFANTPRSNEDNIIEHDCDECRDVWRDFVHITWQEATRTTIEQNYDKLPLFTPTAFRYFLPAYLITSLEDDGDIWEFTFYSLYQTREERGDRWESFNKQEIEAILLVLRQKLLTAEGVDLEDIPKAIRMWEKQLDCKD